MSKPLSARAEHRRARKALRGHLAFVIADTPAHIDRPLDELLAVADAVMATFNVSRRVMR